MNKCFDCGKVVKPKLFRCTKCAKNKVRSGVFYQTKTYKIDK